ncbi:MAG: HIT family protein [Ramlibacter sp.]|nr:HIT family protein [Ramlibacter sp.]
MNATLTRFGYPHANVREYDHWVVLIRPVQPTPLSCVIAARAEVESLGALSRAAAGELPEVIRAFEATVRVLAPAQKFNYLALMMVDPNPHFHALPRYADSVRLGGIDYRDELFPKPPDVLRGLVVDAPTLAQWQAWLAAHWRN